MESCDHSIVVDFNIAHFLSLSDFCIHLAENEIYRLMNIHNAFEI